jgi:hypothetical protein
MWYGDPPGAQEFTRAFSSLTSGNAISELAHLSDHIRPSPAIYEDPCRTRAEVRRSPSAAVARLHPA